MNVRHRINLLQRFAASSRLTPPRSAIVTDLPACAIAFERFAAANLPTTVDEMERRIREWGRFNGVNLLEPQP